VGSPYNEQHLGIQLFREREAHKETRDLLAALKRQRESLVGDLRTICQLLNEEVSAAFHDRPPDWRAFHRFCDLLTAVERVQGELEDKGQDPPLSPETKQETDPP
jgi:hypothetical protein